MSDNFAPEKPNVQFTYGAVIPDAEGPRFLALPVDGGWALPGLSLSANLGDGRLGRFSQTLFEQLDAHLTVLRYLYSEGDYETSRRFDALYLMENHTLGWTPPQTACWVGRETLDNLQLAGPKHRAYLEGWLDEAEGGGEAPERRAPWDHPGWHERAVTWIMERLAALGIEPLGPVEQVRHWSISSILRVPTDAGMVYFKAVPTLFAREPVLTAALAARYPHHILTPLAIDAFPGEGWMLMTDFGTKLAENIAYAQTESATRALARIQVESAEHIEELFAEGCPDRRLETLPGEFRALLADAEALKDLTDDEREKLVALAPRLDAIFEKLASYAVPHTLAHGDFHTGNISIKDGEPVIFDWTDGCVAHPFVDLPVLLEYDTPKEPPDARDRLRDAYLQAWTAYEPMERLVEAFALGEVAAALHQAISYRYIVASLEDSQKWQISGGTSEWLRRLIQKGEK